MLKFLAGYSHLFGPLRVFDSITFRVAVGLALSFFLTLLVGRRFVDWMRELRATEDVSKPDSATLEKLHAGKEGTPTMGGLMIIFTMTLAILLSCDPTNKLVLLGLGVLLSFGLLGFVDDYMKLRGWGEQGLTQGQKLAAQFTLAGLAFWSFSFMANENTTRLLIPFTKWAEVKPDLGGLYGFFFILVIVGCANAVNLTDGLDGLAAGVTVMVAGTYVVLAYVAGNVIWCEFFRIPYVAGSGELAIFCAVMVGAVMGFLWFNAHPAQVFMGDTGSLALGAGIAYVALAIKHELVLAIAGGIFVCEALSVLLQVGSFRSTGRRIFKCAPYHHHLQFRGWHENHVVVRFWILGAILSALALATLKMH